MAEKHRPQRPKARREWTRSPVTQVKQNRREHELRPEKEILGDLLAEIDDNGDARREGQSRVVGVDFGRKRVGLAVSDPFGLIAQGLDTIQVASGSDAVTAVLQVVTRFEADAIVVGLPVNMDGTDSDMTRTVREFIAELEKRTECQVVTWDERLTSTAAERTMSEMGRSTRGRKSEIDRIAATMILQGFLDRNRQGAVGEREPSCPD